MCRFSKKKKMILVVAIFIIIAIMCFGTFFYERYCYQKILNDFFIAIETKDTEKMDEIFYASCIFDYQRTTYSVIREENVVYWDTVEYQVTEAEIYPEIYYIDCWTKRAEYNFRIKCVDYVGSENSLMGNLKIEELDDGSYKITEIHIYDTHNNGFAEVLFGTIRR